MKHIEEAVVAAFCVILIVCIVFGVPVVAALVAGLVLFLGYGLFRKHTVRALLRMCLSGIRTAKNVLITFILIGMLTALWRQSGCIPSIVSYAGSVIRPSVFLLLTFLLNCLVSVLTGTALGTAATMGVICFSIAAAMGLPSLPVGGAVLAGAFFGDRCSPVSTSALLVASVTQTDIYDNIRNMIRSSAVPFAATCAVYAAWGFFLRGESQVSDIREVFSEGFAVSPLCLIPAAVIPVLALFRMKVKGMMLVSIASSVPVAIFVQKQTVTEILRSVLFGYSSPVESLAPMIDGGGISSMLKVAAIVCLASCYSGIFEGTGLLGFMKKYTSSLSEKTGEFASVLIMSLPVSAVSFNQTLAIMLTDQLISPLGFDKEKRALFLENSAVVIAPLIPWSIASSVPLTSIGAPSASVLAACYLYLLPLFNVIREAAVRRKKSRGK